MTLIARYSNPKYAGIVYALPVILITAMVFIYLDQGLAVSQKTLKSAFVYEFTLVYFVLAFYFLLSHINFWSALIVSLVSWMIIAAGIQLFLK